MPKITKFEDLKVWRTSRELTRRIYDISDKGRFKRDFGLRDQIRRASVSAMSNIAEGFESHTTKLFMNYLGRARASAGEVRSQLYVALDRTYLDQTEFDGLAALASDLSRQLRGFSDYLDDAQHKYRVREDILQEYLDE